LFSSVLIANRGEIYGVVDKVIAMIERSGVKYLVGPMETTMEGELEELMALVIEAQRVCTEAGSKRVISIVKIDYKVDGVSIDEKIKKYQE
jgi:uncharacterized protein (TIGR00106 family)